MTDKLDFGE